VVLDGSFEEASFAGRFVALELGFSDLPHLTRSVAALTGAAPSYWRLNGAASGLARQVRSSWRSS
jgi:hypothetical protein